MSTPESLRYRCDGGCGSHAAKPGRCGNCDHGIYVLDEGGLPDAKLDELRETIERKRLAYANDGSHMGGEVYVMAALAAALMAEVDRLRALVASPAPPASRSGTHARRSR